MEVLNKPSSDLKVSQSILEVLLSPPSDFSVSQSIVECLNENGESQADDIRMNVWAGNMFADSEGYEQATFIMTTFDVCSMYTGILVDYLTAKPFMDMHAPEIIDRYDLALAGYQAAVAATC